MNIESYGLATKRAICHIECERNRLCMCLDIRKRRKLNIVHYSLGFPPYRTGGLTKYCTDLMISQVMNGNQVSLLWPGKITPWGKQKIKKHRDYLGVQSFEIINPLPVALDEGVAEPELYMKRGDIHIYEDLFREIHPDVFHIHTLMGLHRELLLAAKEYGVRTVFTTHDYYGICPKVTLFCEGHICVEDNNCLNCTSCNQSGLSIAKIAVLQSTVYRILKDSTMIQSVRKRHRNKFFVEGNEKIESTVVLLRKAEGYQKLREFYLSILGDIDVIHFNSTVTRDVYMRYFKPSVYKVMPISHRDIADHRRIKDFKHDKLRITYLGPAKPFKGYFVLKSALDKLWDSGIRDFELRVFCCVSEASPYIIMRDGYEYRELEGIFDRTDIVAVPSIWYETFGFTVVESLSYGVPVVVSTTVGAKDIVSNIDSSFVLEVLNENRLIQFFADIIKDRSSLMEMNRKICESTTFCFDIRYEELYS